MASNPVLNGLFVHNNTSPPPPSAGILSLFSLKGKTAIVAGAGAGIGLNVAHALAEAGANVALWYHTNTSTPQRAAEIVEKYGVMGKFFLKSFTQKGKGSPSTG